MWPAGPSIRLVILHCLKRRPAHCRRPRAAAATAAAAPMAPAPTELNTEAAVGVSPAAAAAAAESIVPVPVPAAAPVAIAAAAAALTFPWHRCVDGSAGEVEREPRAEGARLSFGTGSISLLISLSGDGDLAGLSDSRKPKVPV